MSSDSYIETPVFGSTCNQIPNTKLYTWSSVASQSERLQPSHAQLQQEIKKTNSNLYIVGKEETGNTQILSSGIIELSRSSIIWNSNFW